MNSADTSDFVDRDAFLPILLFLKVLVSCSSDRIQFLCFKKEQILTRPKGIFSFFFYFALINSLFLRIYKTANELTMSILTVLVLLMGVLVVYKIIWTNLVISSCPLCYDEMSQTCWYSSELFACLQTYRIVQRPFITITCLGIHS